MHWILQAHQPGTSSIFIYIYNYTLARYQPIRSTMCSFFSFLLYFHRPKVCRFHVASAGTGRLHASVEAGAAGAAITAQRGRSWNVRQGKLGNLGELTHTRALPFCFGNLKVTILAWQPGGKHHGFTMPCPCITPGLEAAASFVESRYDFFDAKNCRPNEFSRSPQNMSKGDTLVHEGSNLGCCWE